MNRSKTRDLAFKLLYQIEIQKEINKEIIDLFIENNQIEDEDAVLYIKDIVNGVQENKESIKNKIEKNLKSDWTIERINKINLALLKLSIYEISYKKLPYKIVINEVVELAKRYGDENSSVFINGVLASIIKESL